MPPSSQKGKIQMPELIEITDLKWPQLDAYVRLTDAQLRSKQEPEKGILIAESPHVIEHALEAGCIPLSFLMEHRKIATTAPLIDRCNVPVFTADRDVLCQLTGYEMTRGVLCAMRRPSSSCAEALLPAAKRVAVLEGIVDATNMGAIFRNAAALRMDAVLLSPTCCDPYSRRSLRVSMGTVFQIPWARFEGEWPQNGFALLHSGGFKSVAMALNERSISLESPVLMQADRLAIVLGNEGNGLTEETIAACEHVARIPMAHNVDSLNVAAASAIAFWQLRSR